jgi:cyanuric acid amidohydrolase
MANVKLAEDATIADIIRPAIFVSGGTEHQCGPGEASMATIVRA